MLQRLNYHLAKTDPLADPTPPQKPTIEPNRNARVPFFLLDFLEGEQSSEVVKQNIRDMFAADQHSPWEVVSVFRSKNSRVINQLPVEPSQTLQSRARIPQTGPSG